MKKTLALMMAVVIILFAGCSSKDYIIEPKNPEEKLFRSIRDGNFEATREAIEAGADINKFTNPVLNDETAHNRKTDNPLLISLALGRFSIAKLLIDSGADVNVLDEAGQSVLQYCAEFYPQIIQKVIDAGADISYKDKEGNTAIDYSAMNSFDIIDKRSFEILIENGAVPTSNTIDILLNDLDADEYGLFKTALGKVYNYKTNYEVRNAFLGRTVRKADEDRDLILSGIAAFGSWRNLEKFIGEENEKYIGQLLKKAVMYENMGVIKGIVENCQFDKEVDYLYYAVENQNEEVIEYICYNFDVNLQTAAQHAIKYKNTKAIEYFLNNGLDPNFLIDNESLLYNCCFSNNEEILNLLIEKGAIPDGKALKHACKMGYYNIAKALLEMGADPNFEADNKEPSILFETIKAGQFDCVKLLVENGADTKYEFEGKNALEYSKMFVSEKIRQYFSFLEEE